MRAILIAMLTAGTIGLVGTSETMAAPANGGVLGAATASESLLQDVQYYRRYRGFSRVTVVRRCFHRGFSRRWCQVVRRHR